jgi:hypothetical protein
MMLCSIGYIWKRNGTVRLPQGNMVEHFEAKYHASTKRQPLFPICSVVRERKIDHQYVPVIS